MGAGNQPIHSPTRNSLTVGADAAYTEERAPSRYCRELMARRRSLEPQPYAYLASGEVWPEGELVDDAPDAAHFARRLALGLKQACEDAGGLSMHAIAKQADVNPQTVANLLSGKTWGELPTIFQLESAIKQKLWTHDHLPQSENEPPTGSPDS